MSTLLLLLQPLSITPVVPSGVYALPLTVVVQAVYPNGPESDANIAMSVDESNAPSVIVGQI